METRCPIKNFTSKPYFDTTFNLKSFSINPGAIKNTSTAGVQP